MLEKQGVRISNGSSWLRIEISSWIFWTWWSFGFQKKKKGGEFLDYLATVSFLQRTLVLR